MSATIFVQQFYELYTSQNNVFEKMENKTNGDKLNTLPQENEQF